jgi:hypothetical protein
MMRHERRIDMSESSRKNKAVITIVGDGGMPVSREIELGPNGRLELTSFDNAGIPVKKMNVILNGEEIELKEGVPGPVVTPEDKVRVEQRPRGS